ncbi:MAG: HD-GYP domain-containing protein [Nitrospiraceae bacterium]|nr:HD-GYP domain-containing protein [Nitrospiraceae bacterium]
MGISRQSALLSKDVVNQMAVIVRTSQIHNPTNIAVATSVEKFVLMVNGLIFEEGPVELELIGEYFYLNGERVKFSMEYLLNFDFLQREFKKRSLGRLKFNCEIKPEDVQAFLASFIACQFSADPFEELSAGLEHIKCMETGGLRRISEEAEHDLRKTVKRTYFNAVSFARGVMNKIKTGERVNIKKAKRIVESMVDTLLDKEEFLLGMTAIKNYDEYTFHHSVNVSILSIALGQKIGLGKKALMELGLVALFHDIGKTEIPPEVLNKPSSFTPEEWEIMKKHSAAGVKAICRMKSFDYSSIRSAIVSYEHHIHDGSTGYPKAMRISELDLFSRIVSVADQYDGMTSSRVYSRTPMSPDKALSIMLGRSGTQLDPLLLKFFVNLVGVYPVGSVVMLDTRELGIVSGVNSANFVRPKVTVITDSMGNKTAPYVADLAEKNASGVYVRSIKRALDPVKFKINIAEYLL